MPFRNGIQFDLGNVRLCNPDGDVVGEFYGMKLADIQEFDDTCCTEDPGEEIWGKIDCNREVSFICHYNGVWGAMKKIMYGWTAKGPIRCRVLEKLWKIKRRKRNEDRQ
jgi:hypothetical protein